MGYETYTGLVAREVDFGDADRYLTLLSAERGKLECYARGIRNIKSKLASQAGLLSYGEFQLYGTRDKYTLTSAKAAETFYNIRMDVAKCAYAAHFLEIACDVIVEAQAFPQALQTLLNSLFVLCYRDMPPDFISRVYEIRILSLAGFSPLFDECYKCGAPLQTGSGVGFAVFGDGAVCDAAECRAAAGKIVNVSAGAIKAINYVAGCDANMIFNFKMSDEISGELALFIPHYLRRQFGKEYKKLDEAERYRLFEHEIQDMSGKAKKRDA
jgi:DNA repair protein RecO (recombination protein O)